MKKSINFLFFLGAKFSSRRALCSSSNNSGVDISKFMLRVPLDIKYSEHEEAKLLGAEYDWKKKKWFTILGHLHLFEKLFSRRVYLNIPYVNKDEAKRRGANFDSVKKMWFITDSSKVDMFSDLVVLNNISRNKKEQYFQCDNSEVERTSNLGESLPKENNKFEEKGSNETDNAFTTPSTEIDETVENLRSAIEEETFAISTPPTTRGVLFFDVETTGVPIGSDFSNVRLVQIAMILCDRETLTPIATADSIVRAEGFSIPPIAAKVHGIDTERSLREGQQLQTVLESLWHPFLLRADLIIAHNAQFDIGVLQAELKNAKMSKSLSLLNSLPVICSMKETTSIVQAPKGNGKTGFKYPTLTELFQFACPNEDIGGNAHDARYDVLTLQKAFQALVAKGYYEIKL